MAGVGEEEELCVQRDRLEIARTRQRHTLQPPRGDDWARECHWGTLTIPSSRALLSPVAAGRAPLPDNGKAAVQ